ncbi:MAG: hypothetical protein IID40_09080 [Planctomycetes bacterium]|nr:hypothetical protein [Planctomycetota bacterium]
MLLSKRSAKEGETLGAMIKGLPEDALPAFIAGPLENAFLVFRNQAGHVWTNANDEPLTVDDKSVGFCFDLFGRLFDFLYTRPKADDAFATKAQRLLDAKRGGERKP